MLITLDPLGFQARSSARSRLRSEPTLFHLAEACHVRASIRWSARVQRAAIPVAAAAAAVFALQV